MKAVLVFVDGINLGDSDPEKNPLVKFPLSHIGYYRNGWGVPYPAGDGSTDTAALTGRVDLFGCTTGARP